jgi:hypothetical protein
MHLWFRDLNLDRMSPFIVLYQPGQNNSQLGVGCIMTLRVISGDTVGSSPRLAEEDPVRQADALILESVDETLGDLLGGRVRETVYDCLREYRSIARSEIPTNLNEFFAALDGTFGKKVGKIIAKELHIRLGMKSLKVSSPECRDYVELARAKLDQ